MNLKKLNIVFSILVVLALILGLVLPFITSADTLLDKPPAEGSGEPYVIKIPNPLKNGQDDLPGLLVWVIDNAIIPIGGIVAALMIMYAGFMYVTARGNPGDITKAHQALLWAAVGAAILLGAKVLATAIQGTINQIGS